MEHSGASLEGKCKNEGRGLLAFFYCDALVNTERHNDKTILQETVRLAYKELIGELVKHQGGGQVRAVQQSLALGLGSKQERNMIQRMLARSGKKIRFWSESATTNNVHDRLTSGCQMLHFTGHGGEHSLEVESERCCGMAESLKDDDLTDLFHDGDILPELVFLGSSKSEICGRAVARAGVPHVVAVKSGRDVSDEAAQDFCVPFYDALITGNYTVQKAFDIAVCTVKANAPTAAATFLLLPENANHEVKMFSDLPKGDFIDETPLLPPYFHLPPARRTYIGGIKLREVLSMLEDNNTDCVTITGEPGIGKTERALQACHYMGERNQFGAIFFADCKGAATYPCSFPASGGPQAHIQRLCQLVGVALDVTPAASSPKDLWVSLRKSAISKIGYPPFKVLLVLDAVNVLIEDSGSEARKSLADFVNQLCGTSPHLKLLITSEKGLLELTGCSLSSCTEKVHQVYRLGEKESAMLLLDLYPRFNKRDLAEEVKIEKNATRQKFVEALQQHRLVQLVNGNPGVLCQASPLLANRGLNDPEVERAAIRYLKLVRETTRKIFSNKRAYEISSQAELLDEKCRDIWLWAISRAANDGLTKGHDDDAFYRHVPWSYLSLALQQGLCEVQTTFNGVGIYSSDEDYPWSESSSRSFSGLHSFHGSSFDWDGSFRARDLEKDELSFIRDLLRRPLSKDGNTVDGGECGAATWRGRDSTDYARAGGDYPRNDDEEEWFSLEAFARFSQEWMGPVMVTLSKMQKDWAAIHPIKVHGFVSEDKAKRQLMKTGLAGVFMLRFSVSDPGRLILGVTREAPPNVNSGHSESTLEIQESLVTVKGGGRWTLQYDVDGNDDIPFESLSELVHENCSLKTLYPNIPKAIAFSTT